MYPYAYGYPGMNGYGPMSAMGYGMGGMGMGLGMAGMGGYGVSLFCPCTRSDLERCCAGPYIGPIGYARAEV